jgi:hypothetical protein
MNMTSSNWNGAAKENFRSRKEIFRRAFGRRGFLLAALLLVAVGFAIFYFALDRRWPIEIACMYSGNDDQNWMDFVVNVKGRIRPERPDALYELIEDPTNRQESHEVLIQHSDSRQKILFKWYPVFGKTDTEERIAELRQRGKNSPVAIFLPDSSEVNRSLLDQFANKDRDPVFLLTSASNDGLLEGHNAFRFCAKNSIQVRVVMRGLREYLNETKSTPTYILVRVADHSYTIQVSELFKEEIENLGLPYKSRRAVETFSIPSSLDSLSAETTDAGKELLKRIEAVTKDQKEPGIAVVMMPVTEIYKRIGAKLSDNARSRTLFLCADWLSSDFESLERNWGTDYSPSERSLFLSAPHATLYFSNGAEGAGSRESQKTALENRLLDSVLEAVANLADHRTTSQSIANLHRHHPPSAELAKELRQTGRFTEAGEWTSEGRAGWRLAIRDRDKFLFSSAK